MCLVGLTYASIDSHNHTHEELGIFFVIYQIARENNIQRI